MARLPPFIAMRALEAAVRHKSYSRAAEELHVTHGAVSHQIRRLEEELDVTLFLRRGNVMEPTADAERLAGRIGRALGLLSDAFDELAVQSRAGPLVVSSEPGFARLWMAPRFARLREDIGEGDIELRLEDRVADLVRDGVDVALRLGAGDWPGVKSRLLIRERLFPVCSPAFLASHPLNEPGDLLKVPLLRHTVMPWRLWFEMLGLEPPPDQGSMMFDDTAFMLDAAARGLGVALARGSLAEQELKAGGLVRPFADEIEARWGYFFVWRPDSPKLKRILRLQEWFLAEAGGGRTPG